ncbi:MAG: exopolysaccharide biosynthesis protein [Rhodospirillales bacterium]|nr:exopolysaccharide biosynthesis protein [Rhodospirillales bacterium]
MAKQRGNAAMSNTIPLPTTDKTSVVLKQLLDNLPGEDVSIGYVVIQLRRRSFGGILILLAALGLLPGISMFAGIMMLVPAFQMVLGFRAPSLPYFIRRRRISAVTVRLLGNRFIPWIEKIEFYIRPRWFFLTQPPFPMVIGALVFGLALVVMLPLPFSNFPPALALVCLSLGFLERDGVMIGIGLALAVFALTLGAVMMFFALEAALLLLNAGQN